ncbi:MAG: lipopolysaccharide biosynthesis protein [Acidobacteriia bacterium]|nr:lipopolysaccharide biosynthesis protein [Terriglobia bacterium]
MTTARDTSGAPSLFGAAALLMTGRTIAFAATFLTPVVLARCFTPSEFGTYKQLFLVFATLFPVAQCGMAESLFYFLPGARDAAGRYVANSTALLTAAGLATAALLLAGDGAIARWLGNPSLAEYMPLIAAFSLLMLASAGLEIAMTAQESYRRAATVYAIGDLVRGACLVAPALVFRRLDLVLGGVVAYAGARFLLTLAYYRHVFGAALRLDGRRLAQQLAYGVPFGLAVVLEIAQANYHQYAVAHYFDAATFAIYAVGCLQIPFVDFVATSAGSVMMVRFAQARQDGRDDLALEIWRETTRKLALLFFPMVAVLLVCARELIVTLFTERYAGSVVVFQISLATIALSSFATDAVLRSYARMRFLMSLYAVKLALVAVLVGPCLAAFGLPGAILATVAALALSKAVAVVRMARLFGCGARILPWRSLADIARVAALAALAGFLVKWPLQDTPLAAFAAAALVTGGVSVVLVLQWDLVSADERAALADWVRRTIGRAPETVESGG